MTGALPSIDLDRGDAASLAAAVDQSARRNGAVVLHGHGVDEDVPHLAVGHAFSQADAGPFGDLLRDQQLELTGLAHRVMALFGAALGVGPSWFVDRVTGDASGALCLQGTEQTRSEVSAGLLRILQPGEGAVLELAAPRCNIIWPVPEGSIVVLVGRQLATVTAGRYREARHRLSGLAPEAKSLVLDFAVPRVAATVPARPSSGRHMDMKIDQFSRVPGGSRLPTHERTRHQLR